jgi:allophanate hydrolase
MGCSKVVQSSGRNSSEWITRLSAPLAGAETGALAGLIFAAKDNIDVQGLRTTAGCESFAYQPAAHAEVVRKLLAAGASLAGKTNLDQFACGLNGTRSPWGAVPNAFDARYVSGGSSSGSAYVVATGQVDFALGTDTAGSGRVPAGLNNIIGLKPSKGLISARGVVPAAQSVDCVSIFSRTVGLAVNVLKEAMGEDDLDPYSRALSLRTDPLPEAFRVGVPSSLEFFGDTLAQQAFAEAIERMKALGGRPVPVDFTAFAQSAALLYESAMVAERYEAIRDFYDAHSQDIIEPVRTIVGQGRQYSAADLYRAQTLLKSLEKKAKAIWREMDVLLVPTAPTHYTLAAMQADPIVLNRNLGVYTNFVNLLDYAALSVPSSIRADGLPFGITLIGCAGSELQLAQLGQLYHMATGLTQGATGLPLAEPSVILPAPAVPCVRVAVVGAHLSGMPLNSQLIERGATLIETTQTSADYKLFALPGTVPPKPGLLRVKPGEGAPIAIEVWEMPLAHYGSFVALIPAPLGIGTLSLSDGRQVQGFLCEPLALQGAQDITHMGGWRAYMRSLSSKTV